MRFYSCEETQAQESCSGTTLQSWRVSFLAWRFLWRDWWTLPRMTTIHCHSQVVWSWSLPCHDQWSWRLKNIESALLEVTAEKDCLAKVDDFEVFGFRQVEVWAVEFKWVVVEGKGCLFETKLPYFLYEEYQRIRRDLQTWKVSREHWKQNTFCFLDCHKWTAFRSMRILWTSPQWLPWERPKIKSNLLSPAWHWAVHCWWI